jgi:hypothetical protein
MILSLKPSYGTEDIILLTRSLDKFVLGANKRKRELPKKIMRKTKKLPTKPVLLAKHV